ncbi:cysteine desulfurase family protein [Paenibacillus sp. J2TS4]|uniref:cysteine desulfurase family protein n=1 Tax=Paenibacillus sp. J2TS4 TaxID=2807194 RepID=UPI001B0C9649|nr:cysteine desulfurase family protein [Paenibacillus sp. J2TS4]GIP35810.1 aminotransferase V [Paenibacillus sp. J2TS4]
MLYLDYCATTPMNDEVMESIVKVMQRHYGNPSSIHRIGMEAERLLSKSKEVIAGAIDCKPEEMVFTSGGTESNNLAIKGAARAYRGRGRHLITSAIEHSSVYESFRRLEEEGFQVTYLPVDSSGAVCMEELKQALREDTILVSLMHVNNETGRIQPVEQAGRLLANYPKILYHVDAIQSLGKLPVMPARFGADLMSASAHKIEGPKGAGFLYVREGLKLQPQLDGGGQEGGIRSGTENVPLIVGMAKAVRLAVDRQAANSSRLYRMREELANRIREIPGLYVSGTASGEGMAPHIIHFTYPGMKAEVVVHALEKEDVYISTRSACSSGETKPSRVLLAMGMDRERAASGLRVSFSANETSEELSRFGDLLEQTILSFNATMKG